MLDDATLTRYARQVVIPGVGVAGQEALLAARVLVVGDGPGAEAVELWLSRTGLRVVRGGDDVDDARFDVAVAVDAAKLGRADREGLLGLERPVCWYSIEDGAFLSGVHPEAPLPEASAPGHEAGPEAHAAAAADVAALAAAIVVGLAHRREATRFET